VWFRSEEWNVKITRLRRIQQKKRRSKELIEKHNIKHALGGRLELKQPVGCTIASTDLNKGTYSTPTHTGPHAHGRQTVANRPVHSLPQARPVQVDDEAKRVASLHRLYTPHTGLVKNQFHFSNSIRYQSHAGKSDISDNVYVFPWFFSDFHWLRLTGL